MKHWWLILLHIGVNIAARWFDDGVYFLLTSISWVFVPLFLVFNGLKSHPIIIIWLAFSIGNVIDEIFNIAAVTQANEILFAIIITLFSFYRCYKCLYKKK